MNLVEPPISTVMAALREVQDVIARELGRMSIERALPESESDHTNNANLAWMVLDKMQIDLAKVMYQIKCLEEASDKARPQNR